MDTSQKSEEALAEIDARLALARAIGTAEERKRARKRLGLSVAALADLCGLSVMQVRWREDPRWRLSRSSLAASPEQWLYIELIARARGKSLNV